MLVTFKAIPAEKEYHTLLHGRMYHFIESGNPHKVDTEIGNDLLKAAPHLFTEAVAKKEVVPVAIVSKAVAKNIKKGGKN